MSKAPHGWRTAKLDDIATVQTGLAVNGDSERVDPVQLPYLRVANVQDGHVDLSEVKRITVSRTQISRYSLRAGDVLMTEGGDFDKLGRGTVWNGEIDPCLHQNHVFAVRPDLSQVLSNFLAAYCESAVGKRYFLSCSKQTTNLASINSTQLKEMPIHLPPLEEQKRITELLATWEQALNLSDRLLSAQRQRLLTTTKRLAWSDQDSWTQISEYMTVSRDRVGSGPSLEVYSVTRDGLKPQLAHFSKRIANEDITRHMLLRPGEFALSGLNFWLGSVAVSDLSKDVCISPDYKVFRLTDRARPGFIKHLVRTDGFKELLVTCASERASIVRRNFNRALFLDSEIPVPSVAEQEIRAAVLDAMIAELNVSESRHKLLLSQKRQLVQSLITGDFRLDTRFDAPANSEGPALIGGKC